MKLVFHSSTIAMMHGPINIRLTNCSLEIEVYFLVVASNFLQPL